jgi:hypothetical protein
MRSPPLLIAKTIKTLRSTRVGNGSSPWDWVSKGARLVIVLICEEGNRESNNYCLSVVQHNINSDS